MCLYSVGMTASDFRFDPAEPPATEEDWRELVDGVLKGRSFDSVLVSSTAGGLSIDPLYVPDGSSSVSGVADDHRLRFGWDLRQQHRVGDPAAVSVAVLDDLNGGVTSIELSSEEPLDVSVLAACLDGVLLDVAPVALAPHTNRESAHALLDLLDNAGVSATAGAWLGLDPLGEFARSGQLGDVDAAAELAVAARAAAPNVVAFTVDTCRYADAGASEVDEVAWMLATGVAYLRALESAGCSVADAAATIGFRLSADADQFVTMARLRAARQQWSAVLTACGVVPSVSRFQAVTSAAMFSRCNPAVNILRATSATFAAGVAGVDAVTVLPFDGSADPLARRVARNLQHLLIDESGINRLVDPAGGSAFIESLTARIADAAWAAFQQIESTGGMASALTDGRVRAAVDEAWSREFHAVATRRQVVTGVSEFPDREPVGPHWGSPVDAGFPLRRPAAVFEDLRNAADTARAVGATVAVQVVALGSLAEHTARSTWVQNLLAVGGIDAVDSEHDGASSPLEAAARYSAGGLSLAVICSSDEVYDQRAAATATALKQAGATWVALAGRRADADALRAAGVDAFWHVGVDVVDVLTDVQRRLGVR